MSVYAWVTLGRTVKHLLFAWPYFRYFISAICHILFYNSLIKNYWRGLYFRVCMLSRIYAKIKSTQIKKCFTVNHCLLLWQTYHTCWHDETVNPILDQRSKSRSHGKNIESKKKKLVKMIDTTEAAVLYKHSIWEWTLLIVRSKVKVMGKFWCARVY